LSFGLAGGSLITAWFLGDLPQTDRAALAGALHRAFLTLGAVTILSSMLFRTLGAHDGDSVSRGDRPGGDADRAIGGLRVTD
jgi:hypothetical protein